MIRSVILVIVLAGTGYGWTGVEEDRLDSARAHLPEVTGRFQGFVDRAGQVSDEEELVALGESLWRAAVADVQAGHHDDRPLYWARLAIRHKLLELQPQLPLGRFEHASRGMSTGESGAGRQRLLVTGFDPFHLDVDITQSNPSGLAALALDGTTLDAGGQRVSVATAVMPVRFVDFDEGLVESFFRPHFESGNLVLAVTISMGRDAFDLERFPGRRRSAAVTDNLNVLTGANSSNPKVPRLGDRALDGPEFVEFSLPAQSMASVSGRWLIRDNRQVTTLEKGTLIVDHLRDLEGLTAVAGSGGGYLSNEISYRTLLLNQRLSTRLPVGHLHTPKVAGYDEALENEMVEQIRRILTAAVGAVLSGQ